MKFDPIQTDFSGGELSDRAKGRVKSAIYQAGASRLANMVPTASGSVASRSGGRLIADDLGNLIGAAYDPAALQPVSVIPIKDGPFIEEKLVLSVAQFDWRLWDKHGLYVSPYEAFPGTDSFVTDDGVTTWYDDSENCWFMEQPDATVATPLVIRQSNFNCGVGPAANNNINLEFKIYGDPVLVQVTESGQPLGNMFNAVVKPGTQALGLVCSAPNKVFEVRFTSGGGFGFRQVSSKIYDIVVTHDGMKVDMPGGGIALGEGAKGVSFWANNIFHTVLFAPSTSDSVTPNMALLLYSPPAVPGNRGTPVWTKSVMHYNSTVPGPWTAMAAFQERLWVASNDARSSLFATMVGYGPLVGGVTKFEFGNISAPPKAVEAMQLKLVSPNGVIRWLAALRGMAMGTAHREMLFSQDVSLSIDPLTGAAFDITEYSHYGAALGLPAIEVMDKIIFAAAGARRLRMMGLQFESQGGFGADDITVFAEHLFETGIKDMAHVRSPVSRILCALGDGTAAVCTLVARDNDGILAGAVSTGFSRHVIGAAWSRMSMDTNLTIGLRSFAGLDTDAGSQLWAGTLDGKLMMFKNIDSSTKKKLTSKRVRYDKYEIPITVDGWVNAPLQNDPLFFPTPWCQFLPRYMVGKNVHVFGAGDYLGVFPVISDGANNGILNFPAGMTLDTHWIDPDGKRHATVLQVGLAYPEHKLVLLPLEGGNPLGTAQGYKSRRVQLYARFVDSYLPKVGGFRPAERDDDDVMDGLPLRVTGDYRATQLGFDRAAELEIVQDLPLRFEISAIFGGTQVQSA